MFVIKYPTSDVQCPISIIHFYDCCHKTYRGEARGCSTVGHMGVWSTHGVKSGDMCIL